VNICFLCKRQLSHSDSYYDISKLLKERIAAPVGMKKNDVICDACFVNLKNEHKPLDIKITFDFLKFHLWSAADILRGSLDSSEYRQPVMTLLFLKRLNDTFEENAENLVNKGMNKKEAYNKRRHNFCIPENARWTVFSSTAENIGASN
jgi:hypothetical protein